MSDIGFRDFDGPRDWAYVKSNAMPKWTEDTCGLMAIDVSTNKPVGAAIFDNFTATSCHAHLVVSDPFTLRNGFMQVTAEYIFNLKGMSVIYALVPASNKKAVKFNKHTGWTQKAVLKGAFAKGVDLLLLEMTREDCKYLRQKAA